MVTSPNETIMSTKLNEKQLIAIHLIASGVKASQMVRAALLMKWEKSAKGEMSIRSSFQMENVEGLGVSLIWADGCVLQWTIPLVKMTKGNDTH